MKHLKLIMAIILGVTSGMVFAAPPKAADLFADAPTSVYPLLDRTTRLDMIDYAVNNLTTPSANALDGHSAITELTSESLKLRLTDSSTSQLVVLPTKGDNAVVAVISTVATPGLDSSISFYTTEWSQLPTSGLFAKPVWKDWLTPDGDLATVMSLTPFMLSSYVYDPATKTLTLTNNLSGFLDEDVYETISSSLLPTITYVWDGKKFSKSK
ncbi:MAG: DUF3256 family protein [Muribaculaceae bacterium]|nr:DUF3256 family protein [Muribaculaceae bacterium]